MLYGPMFFLFNNMNMIRRYFGIIGLIAVVLVLSGGFVSAQTTSTATPSSTTPSFTISYPDFANPNVTQDPASFVQNLYTYALGISGVLAVIMIVYGGVKYVVSAGNASALSDALDIIKNAVWGIVLLAGAYLILNTINPEITALKNPVLDPIPDVVDEVDDVVVDLPGDISDEEIQALAQKAQALIASPTIVFSASATCGGGTHAGAIIADTARTGLPLVCSPGCECVRGGESGIIRLNSSMLSTMVYAAEHYERNFMVTSLTGGIHSSGSAHYQGRAADFVVHSSNNPTHWSVFVGLLRANGASRAECEIGGSFVACDALFGEDGGRLPGAHIHAEW